MVQNMLENSRSFKLLICGHGTWPLAKISHNTHVHTVSNVLQHQNVSVQLASAMSKSRSQEMKYRIKKAKLRREEGRKEMKEEKKKKERKKEKRKERGREGRRKGWKKERKTKEEAS